MAIDFTASTATGRTGTRWFRYDSIGSFVIAVDVVAIVGASVSCGVVYRRLVGELNGEVSDFLALGVLFAALFVLLMQLRRLYRPIELLKPLRQVTGVFTLWATVAGFLMLVGFSLKMGQTVSRGATISFILCGATLVAALRFFWQGLMARALASGAFATRRIALIGDAAHLDDGNWPMGSRPSA